VFSWVCRFKFVGFVAGFVTGNSVLTLHEFKTFVKWESVIGLPKYAKQSTTVGKSIDLFGEKLSA
jgi:hypothetical protein